MAITEKDDYYFVLFYPCFIYVRALCCQLCDNCFTTGPISELLGQPCNKSDIPVKLDKNCQQFVLTFRQLGTSSGDTTC